MGNPLCIIFTWWWKTRSNWWKTRSSWWKNCATLSLYDEKLGPIDEKFGLVDEKLARSSRWKNCITLSLSDEKLDPNDEKLGLVDEKLDLVDEKTYLQPADHSIHKALNVFNAVGNTIHVRNRVQFTQKCQTCKITIGFIKKTIWKSLHLVGNIECEGWMQHSWKRLINDVSEVCFGLI